MKLAKPWFLAAAALSAMVGYGGAKAGLFSVVGEARAERPRGICDCAPADLICAMRCAADSRPRKLRPSRRHPLPRDLEPIPARGRPKAVPVKVIQDGPLEAEVSRSGSEPPQLVVRRPGHIVALSMGGKRNVGLGSATLPLQEAVPAGATQPPLAGELIWETTRPGTFALERGTVQIVDDGGAQAAKLSALPPPAAVAVDKRNLHTCATYRDTGTGYTVVCQLDRGAWRVGVANLTGEKPSDDVWATPGEMPTVRLDLPIAKGSAEARLLGYISGSTGIAIRAEASWVEGEADPSITLGVVERPDTSFNFFVRRRPHRPSRFEPIDELMF